MGLITAVALAGVAMGARADTSNQATWFVSAGGNGHTYRVVARTSLVSWDEADAEAKAAGGYLATITSAAENNFVFSLVDDPAYWTQTINGHGPWIGGFQAIGSPEPAGGWSWVTQPGALGAEPLAFTNWEAGEPNDMRATVNNVTYNQDRIAFFHSGMGRAATWSDEYNETGSPLNQWTKSYVIEFGPRPANLVLAVGSNGAVRLSFTNAPGLNFSVLSSTNAGRAGNWTTLGLATETAPGTYEFIDSGASNGVGRFYETTSP